MKVPVVDCVLIDGPDPEREQTYSQLGSARSASTGTCRTSPYDRDGGRIGIHLSNAQFTPPGGSNHDRNSPLRPRSESLTSLEAAGKSRCHSVEETSFVATKRSSLSRLSSGCDAAVRPNSHGLIFPAEILPEALRKSRRARRSQSLFWRAPSMVTSFWPCLTHSTM